MLRWFGTVSEGGGAHARHVRPRPEVSAAGGSVGAPGGSGAPLPRRSWPWTGEIVSVGGALDLGPAIPVSAPRRLRTVVLAATLGFAAGAVAVRLGARRRAGRR